MEKKFQNSNAVQNKGMSLQCIICYSRASEFRAANSEASDLEASRSETSSEAPPFKAAGSEAACSKLGARIP